MTRKSIPKKCGTCRFLRPRSDGKPFHHSHAYACQWKMPSEYKFPASMRSWDWAQRRQQLSEGHIGGYMAPKEGAECDCWEPHSAP